MVKKFDNYSTLGIPNSAYMGLIPFGFSFSSNLLQGARRRKVDKRTIQREANEAIESDTLRQAAAGVKTEQPKNLIRQAERKSLTDLRMSRGFGERLLDFFKGDIY